MERQNLISELIDTYGYREPNDQSVEKCGSYLDKNYLNKDDKVRKAFEMAAEGRLSVELKAVFSVREIMRVMLSYKMSHEKPEYSTIEETPKTSEELAEIEKTFQQTLAKEFNRFCKVGHYYLTPAYCYHYLEDKGIIEKNLHLNEEIIRKAKELTKARVKEQKGYYQAKDLMTSIDKNMMGDDENAIFKTRCMQIAFHQFFKKCSEQKVKFWEQF